MSLISPPYVISWCLGSRPGQSLKRVKRTISYKSKKISVERSLQQAASTSGHLESFSPGELGLIGLGDSRSFSLSKAKPGAACDSPRAFGWAELPATPSSGEKVRKFREEAV